MKQSRLMGLRTTYIIHKVMHNYDGSVDECMTGQRLSFQEHKLTAKRQLGMTKKGKILSDEEELKNPIRDSAHRARSYVNIS